MNQNIIRRIVAAIRAFFKPELDDILGVFNKAQAKLETFIQKELDKMVSETAAIEALTASRETRNSLVDRAYRAIHKLDQLVS